MNPIVPRQLVAFGLVGLLGATTDFGTRQLVLSVGADPTVARAASYLAGSTVAYYLNSYVTFAGTRSRAEKARAAVVYAFCFAVAVLVDSLVRHLFSVLPHVLLISWVTSQAVATVLNFTLQNLWVFKSRAADGDTS